MSNADKVVMGMGFLTMAVLLFFERLANARIDYIKDAWNIRLFARIFLVLVPAYLCFYMFYLRFLE